MSENLNIKIPLNILVVEDDLPSRVFISTILKGYFQNIFMAENGQEGLEVFKEHSPDIIVSDIGMPVMNGLDMARYIRRINPRVPIILTTAFDNKSVLLEAIELGINSYIIKPVQKEQMITVLENVSSSILIERQLKQQEDRLKVLSSAVEHSLSFVLIFDKNGIIEYANPALCDSTGFSPEELIGNNIKLLEVYDFDGYSAYHKAVNEFSEWQGELPVKMKNGDSFWVSSACSLIYNDESLEPKYVQVSEDITVKKIQEDNLIKYNEKLEQKVKERTSALESINQKLLSEIETRKKTEQDLIKAKEAAEAANKAKSLFLAKVTHELRTPMNGVLGMTSILLDSNIDEKQRRALNIVKYSADTLLNIINDLLDWSKIETGKLTLDNRVFNLREMLNHTYDMLFSIAASKGLEFKLHLTNDIPEFFFGDSNRIQQVLINLLGNAIKFTEDGYVELTVQKLNQKDRIVELEFMVKDTGIGIEPEKVSRLFQSFSQIDNTLTRKYGGTGLGLAISKEIVEMMNGKIVCNSVPDVGSSFEFSIQLELSDSSSKLIDSVSDNSLAHIADTYPDFNLSILVVEDSIINQQVINEALLKKNCKVDLANNGKESIDKFKTNAYDLIFMDIQMPGMDGLQATSAIREIEKENKLIRTPIISLTAHDDEHSKIDAKEAGCDGFISKPFKWGEIYKVLNSYYQIKKSKYHNAETVNLTNLMNSINHNKDILKKLSQYFVDNVPQEMIDLRKSVEDNNFEDIVKYSHKMKSEFGNFGAERSVELLKAMEQIGKAKLADSAPKVLLLLEKEVNILINYFKENLI